MKSRGKCSQRFTLDSLYAFMDELVQLRVSTTFHITDGTSERI